MTIVWDMETGRFYSLYWSESDGFIKLRAEEISFNQAKKLCKFHDYIKRGRLEEVLARARESSS